MAPVLGAVYIYCHIGGGGGTVGLRFGAAAPKDPGG